MAHFYLQGLMLLVLLKVISECRDVSPVIANKDEDVILPCFNPDEMDSKSCYRFKWMKYATESSQMTVILARPKTSQIQDAEHVKSEANENSQTSLFLTKLQTSDEGLYSCEVWEGWDRILVKNISLKVRECKALQAVKVAPGTPVDLNCPVDTASGQPGPPDVSWVILKGGKPAPVNSERIEMNGTSLTIQSVNYSDSGWYRCKYRLGQTPRCFDINLLVRALITDEVLKTRQEASSGAFIAVVSSVIIVIAIIAAVIGLFIYRRRNTQRVAQQTQRHPAGTHTESIDGYEVVNFAPSEDPTNKRVNSLYQLFLDESLPTFNY